MAVQAQYPSNIHFLNRKEQESKNMTNGGNNNNNSNYSLQPQPIIKEEFLEQSHMFFNYNNNNEVGVNNPRKRSREMATTYNYSQQNTQFIDISQLQNHQQQQQQKQQQSLVSTGLKLSFGDQNQQQQQSFLSLFSDELSLQFKQHTHHLNYFLNAQGEQFRRTLEEKRQRHYRALLDTAEEAAMQRVREKEAEVNIAVRRNAELQSRTTQITAEAHAWEARARDQEAQAVSLQSQIQQAMIRPVTLDGPLDHDRDGNGLQYAGEAEDTESIHIDPTSETRVNSRFCKLCRTRAVSIVMLPCRHLCLCVQCDGLVKACPVCHSLKSASVEVYFG